jgi:LmbE family N-acetylglucosaminyl deacetylase
MTPNEIEQELITFTGTEGYHRINPLMPNVVGTDGAMRMAELCEAFWLLDVIASHMPSVPDEESFAVAWLRKQINDQWLFTLSDDLPPEVTFAAQPIEFSDFPLDEIKLYVGRQDQYWVVMLTSEY